jgi:glutamyl-tRNA reductase
VEHHNTPLALLERLHPSSRGTASTGAIRSRCEGVVALETCHRVELFLEGVRPQDAASVFASWLDLSGPELEEASRSVALRVGEDAARHLLRVSAGLESAVLGEDQVLFQVRSAYARSCASREAGPLLHRLFHAAFRCGRRVRAETSLGRGGRSLAGAAIAFASRELGGLAGRHALVIGAGEMGALAAHRLKERGVARLVVCSRTTERAQAVAGESGAAVLPWAWRHAVLAEFDVIVCATGAPHAVLAGGALAEAARGRRSPLVVADLAVPRDVEVPTGAPCGLVLADVDVLSQDLHADAANREASVAAAAAIVEGELQEWLTWVWARPRGGGAGVEGRGGSLAG